MGFLRSEIESQKWYEKQAEKEAIFKKYNISKDALIYEMHFEKSVFKKETEVIEYLSGKYLSTDVIDEEDSKFVAKVLNYRQVDMSTSIQIEIRRGVIAYAADIIRYNDEYNFSDKENRLIAIGCKLRTISLSEKEKDLPQVIEIARVVKGDHPVHGTIEITKEHLKEFVTNFNDKVTGTDLAINEDHKKNEAFGWLKDVFLNEEGTIAYGMVTWNTKGTRALSEKEYRYFSPEFRFSYVHPHTKKEYGATLLGGALTNYPFLKMDAITELSQKTQNTNKGTKMDKPTIELAVHEKSILDLNTKLNESNSKLTAAEAKVVELSSKISSMEEETAKKAKEAAHEKLFNDGKINKAQLVALNEGKSMLEVIALNENITQAPKGHTKTGSDIHLSEEDKKVAKSLGLTEEEYISANK